MELTALIGPAVIAVLVSSLFALWRERTTERRRRDARVRDIQTALSAEI